MSIQLFPVQNSTLSAEALTERVLRRYRLPGRVTCRFFRKSACDTYKVDAGSEEYYLKVYMYSRRTRKDVAEEVRLLNHLDSCDVSVARPIPRVDGLYISRLAAPEGTRYAALFEAACGEQVDDIDYNRDSAYGEMVARMHQSAEKLHPPYGRTHLDMCHLVDENLRVIEPIMTHREADCGLIRDIGEHCKKKISKFLSKSEPEYGICHGDLHGGDVSYDKNNLPTLFDFDSSGCGWRALDIGVFLASDKWMDITDEAEDRRQRRLEAFLKGYSAIRNLGENELSAVQLGPPVRHIYLMGFVLRYFTVWDGEYFADDDFIDWHMAWFKHWAGRNL